MVQEVRFKPYKGKSKQVTHKTLQEKSLWVSNPIRESQNDTPFIRDLYKDLFQTL